MKTLKFGLCLAALFGVSLTSAQHSGAPDTSTLEPKWKNVVMAISDGQLIPLERQGKPSMKTRVKGLLGVRAIAVFHGTTSPVVVSPNVEFVVKNDEISSGTDPATMIQLDRLEGGKKGREILVSTTTSFVNVKQDIVDATLLLQFESYGGSVRISPGTLNPGEYVFSINGSDFYYLFRVEKPQPREP